MNKMWIFWLFAAAAFTAVACDDMEDFPLDDGGSDGGSDSVTDDDGNAVETTTTDGEQTQMADLDMNDEGPVDANDNNNNMADRKSDTIQKLVQAAMRKPGMKERLAQVVPIVKAMGPAQRLALAGMVMGKGGQPQNMNNRMLNAQLLLPISHDIAAMLRNGAAGAESSARASSGYGSYHLSVPPKRPQRLPSTLIRRYPQRISEPPSLKRPAYPPPPPPAAVHRQHVRPESSPASESPLDDCDLFGDNICLNVQAYPDLEILESIEDTANSRSAFQALIKDPKHNISDSFDANISERRIDGNSGDAICQSKVTMSRPKKARSTNGQWKYVVNTDEYVQTLRLEKCLKPETRCSHVSTKFKSTCHQVYNYHRLLTWDQFSGLTMDIFKVPTCCACHLQELNPLTPDNFETNNYLADDQHTQSSNINQKKLGPHKRNQQSTSPSQHVVRETLPMKYPPVTRRPYKKNRNKSTTQNVPTESPEPGYQTTRTNYNYHPIMEYFVSPQPSSQSQLPPSQPQQPSLPTTEVRVQDVMQRKTDVASHGANDFQSANNGWTPMSEEFGPRSLK